MSSLFIVSAAIVLILVGAAAAARRLTPHDSREPMEYEAPHDDRWGGDW